MTISIKPTASGSTIEQDGSTILTVDGSGNITAANNFSATGHVLQVVNTFSDIYVSTYSSSFVASGLSASITPKSTLNKVLVQIRLNGVNETGGISGFALYKNGSLLTYLGSSVTYNASTNETNSMAYDYLDSPATTSSVSYQIYFRNESGSLYTRIGDYENGTIKERNCITLMEIAG